jgi:hypothetical protein
MSILIKLRNKNSFTKVWHNQKNIHNFASLNIFKMLRMTQHTNKISRRFPIGDRVGRGACFAIR